MKSPSSVKEKNNMYLTNEVEIKLAQLIKEKVEFSLFYRSQSVRQSEETMKSYEKLFRFLTNEGNESHRQVWSSLINQIGGQIENAKETLANAKEMNADELDWLEEINNNIHDGQYVEAYFKPLFKMAKSMGITEEFTDAEKEMMYKYGFKERPVEMYQPQEEKPLEQ